MNTINLMELENQVRKIHNEAQSQSGGIPRLIRALEGGLALLRQTYTTLAETPGHAGWEQWLTDNFYALEGHAKQALGDLRGFRKGGESLFRFYWLLDGIFASGQTALTKAHVTAVLEAAGTLAEIPQLQFDFVPCALKCAMIFAAAQACSHACPEQEREPLIAYGVGGLSQLYELDFEEITCHVSAVEQLFLQDPSGDYPKMAEQTRRHYRCVTARIARQCGLRESEVARDVLDCARKASGGLERHVGYYLLGQDPQKRSAHRRGTAAIVISCTLPLLLCLLLWVAGSRTAAILGYLPLVELVRMIAWRLALRGIPAGHIPRMKLGADAPKTVIAVSTLLPDASRAEELRTRLEQLYFSNHDPNLYFCVLADFKEDKRPYNPQDDLHIGASKAVIQRLNRQYGNRFMLFVRRRTYSPTQGCYAGWERKRGAITEFIRFMRGGETSVFCFEGDRDALTGMQYLLALDSDTNLSFQSANVLVSAAVHPLNRPVTGRHNRVVSGYGVLVPRMETDLLSAKRTDFTRIMAGTGGVSTYEQESSDFYQDLFGEAIFSGKGLMDIDAFHTVVGRRFPENAVLSHDILEGAYLRVGLLSDVEMTDGMPTNALSWFARLHRWLRGDWQNLRFLGKWYTLSGVRRPNPITGLSRCKLIDNLRRSLVPIVAFLCVMAGCFTDAKQALLLCGLAFFSVSLGPLLGGILSLTGGGAFAVSRRFFARTLPRAFEQFGQALLFFVMTAQQAVVAGDAILRSLWRMLISKKNLLQWTTAAQGEIREAGFFAVLRRSWISQWAGLILLIFAPQGHLSVKLCGLLFLLYTPVAAATSRAVPERKNLPDRVQRERILSWCAQMFAFYEDYANEENHWLPPDNVQFSPSDAVARRTSPTNIGMMMLSQLAARDFHFIDSAGLSLRLTRTLDTLDMLETRHGNLYNWYATDDLRILPDYFVSAVDSGNYLCALVALKEGLYEYAGQEPSLREVIRRIEQILKTTDLSVFYNKTRRLFSIGMDQDGKLSGSHYDFLMSEARTAGYYAIATRQADYKHWRALNRTMSRSGVYAGPVSWTGTMFEYFMPHLLLPVYDGSLLGEAMHYALYCQKKRAHQAGVPWGISESGYFAFDEHLNYQYKAHGVQKLGVKQGLDRECVISPYSTFLTLSFDLEGGMKNLKRLEELGLAGRYGFYEAIDFTRPRCGINGCIVRSYMAHHVGMSILACANALSGNVMQKRFMRDHAMRSAREFLQEKISKDTVVYDKMKPEIEPKEQPQKELSTGAVPVSALSPKCALLSNGSLTHLLADTGASWIRFSHCDVSRRPWDPLGHSQGILAVVKMCGETISATKAPFYQTGVDHFCTVSTYAVTYTARKGGVELEQRFTIDRGMPVERCALTLHNNTGIKAVAEVFFYLEPVLAPQGEYAAHPAFSKLFLTGGRDAATDSIHFSRRNRDGSPGLFLAVGFDQRCDYAFALRREDVTPYSQGMEHLLHFDSIQMDGGTATPDGCCALRLMVTVPAHGTKEVSLLLSAADSMEEAGGNLAAARERATIPAPSPLVNDTMPGRLGMFLLSRLFLGGADSGENVQALWENTRGQDALWTMGISGDLPIVLFDWMLLPDRACLEAYVHLWELMRLHRLEFDLCVLHGEEPPPLLPSGVRMISVDQAESSALTALRAAACHLAAGSALPEPPDYAPVALLHPQPAEIPAGEDRFDVVGGAYVKDRFYVERVTPLPFSHILSNGNIGCLLQDAGLGNSWWRSARECKLSPWNNDIASGNDGERILLGMDSGIYDLCQGARASFSPEDAVYEGMAEGIKTKVRVSLAPEEGIKYMDITLENQREEALEVVCAYGLEPVLGVNRATAKFIRFEQREGCLLLHNPYDTAMKCTAAVYVPGEHPSFTVNRGAFLAGDWSASELMPNNDPIAGTIVRKRLPARHREKIRFILAAAESPEKAAALATAPEPEPAIPTGGIRICTPDEPLNRYINTFAPHQILAGRLLGRCGFYQCSGAYGFRDQLQDVGAFLSVDPAMAREQIIRCCKVQFEEGDVLHWWHDLPSGIKGVRTRFSDDLLWLPYILCDYIEVTGDTALLDLSLPYGKAEPLAPGEQERYLELAESGLHEDVFQHCIRAIEHGYQLGDRGIPKIGCGDWNDGFSNVGTGGEGQSVWLGMFLAIVLERFAKLCDLGGDSYRASTYRGNAVHLRDSIDRNCWDGRWYLRAFYDDGKPLGGHSCEECQIDLLSQSFAVLADMPDKARVNAALDSSMHRLVDTEYQLVKLFAPPFHVSEENPGYIKAYPPGIRENGGQYTHAAVWFAMALLESGRVEEGWKLLEMLNPTHRCTDAKLGQLFKTEPYYMPADIYTNSGAYGHGGWSIYTGAAAWYYRAVTGHLLGIRLRGDHLELCPAIPAGWSGFSAVITGAHGKVTVAVKRGEVPGLTVDGVSALRIPLDGLEHMVELTVAEDKNNNVL